MGDSAVTQFRLIIGGAVLLAFIAIIGLWQWERSQTAKWKTSAGVYAERARIWEQQANLERNVTIITETRDRNIAAARQAATTATEEVHNASDLNSALSAYDAGLVSVRDAGYAPIVEPGVDGVGSDASR